MRFSNRQKKQLLDNYGPWCLVTGATSKIGRGLSRELAGAGFNLVLNARNKSKLALLAEELEDTYGILTDPIPSDLSSLYGAIVLLEAIGDLPIGLFVATAGVERFGEFIEANISAELKMLQVNNLTLMMLTHHFARHFAERKKGGIILMSSVLAYHGMPNAAHHAATKAFVKSFGEGLYHELKPYNVDVLAAVPLTVSNGLMQDANGRFTEMASEYMPVRILRALGKQSTVYPSLFIRMLLLSMSALPLWSKIRITKMLIKDFDRPQLMHEKELLMAKKQKEYPI